MDQPSLAQRCADATAAFLAAMHAAGDPGAEKTTFRGASGLRRRPRGWTVRAVERLNDDPLNLEYEPGLLLTTDGRYHRVECEVRGDRRGHRATGAVRVDRADARCLEFARP